MGSFGQDQPENCIKLGVQNLSLTVVSHRLTTVVALVQSQVKSCGICGEPSGTGAGFLRVLPFPQPILIPPNALHSSNTRG
jgi:hypothetical protein